MELLVAFGRMRWKGAYRKASSCVGAVCSDRMSVARDLSVRMVSAN